MKFLDDITVYLLIFILFLLFITIFASFDVRLKKMEIIHSNYSVCTECGNITIKE